MGAGSSTLTVGADVYSEGDLHTMLCVFAGPRWVLATRGAAESVQYLPLSALGAGRQQHSGYQCRWVDHCPWLPGPVDVRTVPLP